MLVSQQNFLVKNPWVMRIRCIPLQATSQNWVTWSALRKTSVHEHEIFTSSDQWWFMPLELATCLLWNQKISCISTNHSSLGREEWSGCWVSNGQCLLYAQTSAWHLEGTQYIFAEEGIGEWMTGSVFKTNFDISHTSKTFPFASEIFLKVVFWLANSKSKWKIM